MCKWGDTVVIQAPQTRRRSPRSDIFVKTNISDALEKDMSKRTWKNEAVSVCGVTDCYQPAELKYALMRELS